MGEPVVVLRGFEQRQRFAREALNFIGRALAGTHSRHRGNGAREGCVGVVLRL
jgi:hypothetical protein